MKTRFNTLDLVCCLQELQKLVGMRVNQIYDIDNRTYLIRLHRNEEKNVLLLESGNRMHTTAFEWPKNVSPSGFTMKMRKHLKNKRLEKIVQLGIDRIVDLQFGTELAAYHIILELYDRGNIVLCDHEYTILNILRPHIEGEEVRFVVREKYPLDRAKPDVAPDMNAVKESLKSGRPGDSIRGLLNTLLPYGPALIEHCLIKYDLSNCKFPGEVESVEQGESKKKKKQKKKELGKDAREFDMEKDFPLLMNAVNDMATILKDMKTNQSKGFITQKKETKPSQTGEEEFYYTNVEFNPILYNQRSSEPYNEFDSFNLAVDEFFSTMEGQKIDLKAFQLEREALKKLSNVKQDHARRLEELTAVQKFDQKKAELITRNQKLVDSAITAIRTALANQMSWVDIQELVKVAHKNKDPVASCIKQLKLEINHISLYLSDPYANLDDDDSDEEREEGEEKLESMTIDVDLSLSAYSNATRYYDQKRGAAKKEQKTIEASGKALKNAERKTQQTLKDVRVQTSISKARKVFWFEKFYWFISSENYLVIGGRDQQQNELIVKRYMRQNDIYVHAEIQGASSVVIKNPSGGEIPPKTLLEAGTMAICYSVAWDAKVVTSAYWVKSEQVSKTAPTGEYLSTGSFMIRGKKNFLPPCHLILGLSFLFKLEESSMERHKGERRVRKFDDDEMSVTTATTENEQMESIQEDEEIPLEGSDDDEKIEQAIKSELSEKVDELQLEPQPETSKTSKDSGESAKEDGSEESDDDGPKFPDTHIKIEHDTGKVTMQADPKLERLQSMENQEEETLIQAAPLKVKKYEQKLKPKKKTQKQQEEVKEESSKRDPNQPKRGQKGKLKKIKEKYKDQDEEERLMRMEILKSAGSGKDSRRGKKQEEEENFKKAAARKPQPKPKAMADDDEVAPVNDDLEMLESLTGIPMDEDELLFAIPVVAPYQTLHNYKYKVKLTPGTGKRGKASKTAVQIFMKDKTCSQREKDVMKGVKDEVLARNMPGKVKISAPQLLKFKK